MTREIERVANIPVVQIATIVPIMLTVGTNRVVPGVAIPHPVGDPRKGPEIDHTLRRNLLLKALDAMQTEIQEQTIFEYDTRSEGSKAYAQLVREVITQNERRK